MNFAGFLPVTNNEIKLALAERMASSSIHVPLSLPLGNLKRMPLGLRLAILIALLMVLGMAVMSLAVASKQNELRHRQIVDFGNALASQLAASAVEPMFTNDSLALEVQTRNFVNLPRIEGAIIKDADGNILARSGGAASTVANPEPVGGIAALLEMPPAVLSFSSPISFKNTTAGLAVINVRTDQLSRLYTNAQRALAFTCAIVTFIAIGVAWLISRYVSRPISQILSATRDISTGNLAVTAVERRGDELGQLMAAISEMGEGLLQKKQVETLLARFLAKDVADEVLSQLDTVNIGGERVEATVLFADIVGFTAMSEQLSPEDVASFLNEYYDYFNMCSRLYFGSVDKFIGDCAMVVFGAPKADADHRFHAVACAVLIQRLIKNLNEIRKAEGKPEVEVRIGVNTGQMLAGVMGAQDRMEYTVVGDAVNLASRLCGEATGGEIIIEENLYRNLHGQEKIQASSLKQIRLRGKSQPTMIYTVEGVAQDQQMTMNSLIDDVLSSKGGA